MYFHSQTNLLVTFIINWQYILELSIFSTRISHNLGSEFIGTTNFGGVAKIQPVFTLIFLAELPQNREGFAELAQNLLFFSRRILHGISDILPRNYYFFFLHNIL